jgi:HSP20 family protein
VSALLRRDPGTMFPDLVESFEEPFLTLRRYLGQPVRIEDFVEGDHYLVRAELVGIGPKMPGTADEEGVTATCRDGILTVSVGIKPEKKEAAKRIEVKSSR